VRFQRKHAVLFWVIAAWIVITYANFAKNLATTAASGEDRPTGYYVAHIVLIVVNVGIAAALAELGRRVWRGASATDAGAPQRVTR
jgi:hypothetical protein